jgi:hypothetical protein
MTKQLTFTIQCGENTCEYENGRCDYLWEDNERSSCVVFKQELMRKSTLTTLRCKQCKEASR